MLELVSQAIRGFLEAAVPPPEPETRAFGWVRLGDLSEDVARDHPGCAILTLYRFEPDAFAAPGPQLQERPPRARPLPMTLHFAVRFTSPSHEHCLRALSRVLRAFHVDPVIEVEDHVPADELAEARAQGDVPRTVQVELVSPTVDELGLLWSRTRRTLPLAVYYRVRVALVPGERLLPAPRVLDVPRPRAGSFVKDQRGDLRPEPSLTVEHVVRFRHAVTGEPISIAQLQPMSEPAPGIDVLLRGNALVVTRDAERLVDDDVGVVSVGVTLGGPFDPDALADEGLLSIDDLAVPSESGTAQHEVVVEPAPLRLCVQLVDERGRPVEGAEVSVAGRDGAESRALQELDPGGVATPGVYWTGAVAWTAAHCEAALTVDGHRVSLRLDFRRAVMRRRVVVRGDGLG